MGAKWRAAQKNKNNANGYGDVVEGYSAFDPAIVDTTQGQLSGQSGNGRGNYETFANAAANYPGPMIEMVHGEFAGPDSWPMNYWAEDTLYAVGSVKDQINYEVQGQRGRLDTLPYSTGVVDASLVENFEYRGQQVMLRRETDKRQAVGPVGTSDYAGGLAITYAMLTSRFYPNEVSQSDLVRAV